MEYRVQLRHFVSGNADVAAVEAKFEQKFKFLEKLANNDIPVVVKIKQKGKSVNGEFNQRKDAFHMRLSCVLKSGADFMYETEGLNFDEAFNNLRKGVKENIMQRKDKKMTKHQYMIQKEDKRIREFEEDMARHENFGEE